ncbi:MAG: hypothetical protein RR342_01085 [Bacilli bacterium]
METVFIKDNSSNITYYLIGIKEISPSKTATLTEYPIPEGGYISDHSYRNPDTLNFSMMSDGYNNMKKSYYIDQYGVTTNLSYESLKELFNTWLNNAIQLDIQTVHGQFKNMVLNSISWRENEHDWSRFTPSLVFKETRIATLYTTKVNTLNVQTGADYSTEESTGETSGTETTSASVVGGTLAGVAMGAGIGAAVGSIIPGIGTAVGAGIGAVAGGIIGFFKNVFGG